MKEIETIVKAMNFDCQVTIRLAGKKASVEAKAGTVTATGDPCLLAECIRLIKKEQALTINKVNAANYIRTELKKIGKFRSSKKQKRS